MALDVDPPPPPDLTNRPPPSDLDPAGAVDDIGDRRREELEELLADGAWTDAFLEWADYTDLTESAYRSVRELGLFERLDFYWDPTEERLRFEVPSVAELAPREELGGLAAAELTDLGELVVETLERGYVDWGEPSEGEDDWRDGVFDDDAFEDDDAFGDR
ncbi:hypothetical protein [Halorubrum sp. Atlit-26R]|uniref:hypothetical protein n=1 Tax=Halorubrum sp. Atlit-26R TaxID=2282128 RepID=UPI000EF194F4|nr:hypothetical protein [Halorubrum sp. Atlit-26R]RLM64158.1 hypothetical protein DVK07_14520 [Halorubrum sp. Atlit-26R]